MNYKGTHKSASEIARELGVSYLLEGSIGHVGDRVRVTAQLIQASDQTHMWSSEYDSDLGNLLQLESDVAGAIAQQVRIKLVAGTPARYTQEVVPESQVAYLRGLADWNLRTTRCPTPRSPGVMPSVRFSVWGVPWRQCLWRGTYRSGRLSWIQA
jgi:hypothetical protein